jgi:hypothetical protein
MRTASGVRLAASSSALTALLALLPLSCNGATQVNVIITTDMPCDRLLGTALIVGHIDEYNDKGVTDSTLNCREEGSRRYIGNIIVVPSGVSDEFGVKIVTGVDTKPEGCIETQDYRGCIVAKRELKFITHETLELPILMSGSCKNVACPDVHLTCVLGECVPAKIADNDPCYTQENPQCSSDVLTPGADTTKGPAGCGRPSVISDAFTEPTPSSVWTMKGLTSQGGTLVLTPPQGGTPPVSEYRSEHAVNLDEDAIRVEVPAMVETTSAARAYLAAEFDPMNKLVIEQQGGKLRFLHYVNSTEPQSGDELVYDPAQHRVWEIREIGENIVLWVSADGKNWIIGDVFEKPDPKYASVVNIVLGVEADPEKPEVGAVQFDELNTYRTSTVWCAAGTFSDTFDDNVIGPEWDIPPPMPGFPNDCTATEAEMSASFIANGADSGFCAYRTRSAFDLTTNPVTVKLESVSEFNPNVEFSLMVEDGDSHRIELAVHAHPMGGHELISRITAGGTTIDGFHPYDPTHKYLRIGWEGGKFTWRTSADGKDFDKQPPVKSEAAEMTLTAVHVLFGIRANQAVGYPITAKFSEYNVTPP